MIEAECNEKGFGDIQFNEIIGNHRIGFTVKGGYLKPNRVCQNTR